ncbi:BTB/POZ domain-containing protein FBL11 isoform X3 [Humulus lupulus]|uniref:BTB/POZ domain-containing protein FBL11 isoform X3 n=1 Tax=Humulus lupulus TaxID=3486 RepID=UPI002B409E5B|nr:BTB/POZ domain-containing protein FBL11 isoform X3 [Humulus lupulus]
MASSSDDDNDFIILTITNSNQFEENSVSDQDLFLSATDISSWDLPSILTFSTLRVQAHRTRLIEQSSYFHGMLSWSFSESRLDHISIEWELEAFVNILKCLYGCSVDVTFDNFLNFYEGALYFGVKILLEKCKTWFLEVVSSTVPSQMQLDDLIYIWNFGFKHANDYLPELCTSYLAKNFMWAVSCKSFVDVPYRLLQDCVKHPHLTIQNEMHLSDALFMWIDASTKDLNKMENNCTDILKQIRLSLLPLWFAAGKRRNCHYTKLVDESIASVFKLLKISPAGSLRFLEGGDLKDFRIRVTEYSKKLNLSSCPQITSAILLLSLLPSLNCTDSMLRSSVKQLLTKLESLERDPYLISQGLLPMLSFEAVEEVDISKCDKLHLRAAIECFSMSFPSLKILKAAYLLNFSISFLRQLVLKCPAICEVDLAVDVSPIILEVSNNSLTSGVRLVDVSPLHTSKVRLSNITKLTLEGRTELCDSDLLYIAKFCINLQHLNLNGCTTLTDVGMSNLLHRCLRLKSILVCHTTFGLNSVLALCSDFHGYDNTSTQISVSLAFNIQTLHIGDCKCVDETSLLKLLSETQMLKSLCLRDTHITDRALCSIHGSSLEMLDVSNTMVSREALTHIISGNPGLKCLRVKGCRNLFEYKSNAAMGEFSYLNSCGEVEIALGKTCRLQEISLGWGFSHFSMEALKPAITSLRKLTVGLGASLGEAALTELPSTCPFLESIALYFQVISDIIIVNILESLRNLQVLALCYCFGDISFVAFKFYMPNLRKLQLERVSPWMTNEDLVILTQSFPNLAEFSLLGCQHLNSDSQQIISHGWPGLLSIHLEECGKITANGVSSLLECVALEDLLLRHTGHGIQRSFIQDAASKMPLLRRVSLDLCDASDGYFDIPPDDEKSYLRFVMIARCKSMECGLALHCLEPRRKRVHKETLLVSWTSENVISRVVKERL